MALMWAELIYDIHFTECWWKVSSYSYGSVITTATASNAAVVAEEQNTLNGFNYIFL